MRSGTLARIIMTSVLMASPAMAAFTEYTNNMTPLDWYATFSNILTFDGLSDNVCNGSGTSTGCSNGMIIGGVQFIGFYNTNYATNSVLTLCNEGDLYCDYGHKDAYGNTIANASILKGDSAGATNIPIGFRIVLPSPVTAFAVQVSTNLSSGSYNITLNVSGGTTGSSTQAATTTTSLGVKQFVGIQSDSTTFDTIDIVGTGAPLAGYRLVIDDLAYGDMPSGGSSTPEVHSAFYLLTGIAAMALGHRRFAIHR